MAGLSGGCGVSVGVSGGGPFREEAVGQAMKPLESVWPLSG